MKKTLKRLCTGFLALATVVTALPTTPVHAESKQYWTESAERVGIIEKVMNDGSIGSTFNEGYMKVEGETAYCIDINLHRIMIRPHGAVLPTRMGIVEILTELSKAVCLLRNYKQGGIDMEKKLIRYSMQIAMLNQLLARKMISEREYALVKSKLMQDYKIVSDITA